MILSYSEYRDTIDLSKVTAMFLVSEIDIIGYDLLTDTREFRQFLCGGLWLQKRSLHSDNGRFFYFIQKNSFEFWEDQQEIVFGYKTVISIIGENQ